MKKQIIAAILFICLAANMLYGCTSAQKIDLTSEHNGETVEFVDEVIREYMSLPFDESLDYLHRNSFLSTGISHDAQTVTLRWEGGKEPYTVTVATAEDLSDGFTFATNKCTYTPGTLYPDTVYYWSVADSDRANSEIGSFRTGSGPRIIGLRKYAGADGVRNVRDMGGIRAGEAVVRYGLLYRGGMFEFPTQAQMFSKDLIEEFGTQALPQLHLATELDLRNDSDRGNQQKSPAENCAYVNVTFTGYTSIFPSSTNPDSIYFDDRTPATLQTVFHMLSLKESYPLYFHCMIGQDRTGTLAYLILGVLGVDYEDIVRDYELSAFSKVGNMDRSTPFKYTGKDGVVTQEAAFDSMHETMMRVYGTDSGLLKDAVENYLVSECGVTHEELEQMRSILLEK